MESADNREQPTATNQLSKIETLKLLNDSIDQLEEVIESINASSSNNLPPATAMNTLVATTKKLATAVTNPPTVSPAPVAPPPPQESVKSVSSSPEVIKTTPPVVKANQIPNQVSSNKTSKNKTLGLIGIGISAIAVIIVAIFWLWLPQHPMGFSANPQSIDTEDTEIVTTTDDINPETTETTEVSKTPFITPEEIPSKTDTSAESLTADGENLEIESPAEIPIPQGLGSPGRPKDLKVSIIEPEQLHLTPEQTLVAALQTKVGAIIQDYPEDLLNSVEVDFGQHSLVVKVNDLWYELNESRQTKLANQILERSRKLDLTKLELRDIGGTLVARNPVIGNQVIILQKTPENTELQE